MKIIMKTPFILASSSPFRKSILEKILPVFESFSPNIDESPKANESVIELVERLALEKAKTALQFYQQGVVIGSDQVAVFETPNNKGQILGKPHTRDNAIKQLSLFSGNKVRFITSLAVFDIATNNTLVTHDTTDVYFKTLRQAQIEQYIDKEQPLNCAGSFKSEGLGIVLFDKILGEDPNSLVGLPLIKLTNLLAQIGIDPLDLK